LRSKSLIQAILSERALKSQQPQGTFKLRVAGSNPAGVAGKSAEKSYISYHFGRTAVVPGMDGKRNKMRPNWSKRTLSRAKVTHYLTHSETDIERDWRA
jgi:hypothetical protein